MRQDSEGYLGRLSDQIANHPAINGDFDRPPSGGNFDSVVKRPYWHRLEQRDLQLEVRHLLDGDICVEVRNPDAFEIPGGGAVVLDRDLLRLFAALLPPLENDLIRNRLRFAPDHALDFERQIRRFRIIGVNVDPAAGAAFL